MSNHQPYNREFAPPPGYGPPHHHVPPHPHPGMPSFVVSQQFQNPMAFQQRIPAVYPPHIAPQMHHQPPPPSVPVATRRERKPIVLQNPVTKEEKIIEPANRRPIVEAPVIQAPPIVPQPQLAPPVTVSAPPRRSKIIISRPDDPPKKTDETASTPSTDVEQKNDSTTSSSSVASPVQETKQPEPSEQTSSPSTPSDKEKEEVKETKVEEEKALTSSEEPAKTQESVTDDKPATPEPAPKVPESATEEAAPSKDKEEIPEATTSTPEATEKTPESTETPSESTTTTTTTTTATATPTTPDASEKPEEKSEATPEADGEGEEEEWEKKDVDTMKEEFIEQVKGTNSSLNDSGIKFYSADFLMKFRDVEVCKEKPIEFRDINFGPTHNNFSSRNNLRNSRDGNAIRQSTERGGKGRSSRYGGGDDGPRSDYKRGGKKNNRGGNNRQPSAPSRPIIKPAANEHEKNVRKVVSILNKIAPDTFDKLSTQIATLVTEDLLQEITEKIFEKAVAEPTYSNMYAKLCERLVKQANGGEENIATFRRALLNLCQNEFKQRREQLGLDNSDVQVNENANFLLRKRMRGNMEFVGELFNLQGLLSAKVIVLCFQELLSNPDNVNIEAFCKLLTTVGKQLDRIAPSKVKPLFDQIYPLVTSPTLESRIKFMLKDLIDLWKNNWIPRREQDRPQTIAEIHSAAEHAKTESYKQEQRQLRKSTFGNQQSSSSVKSNNPNRGAGFVSNLKSSKAGIPLNASTGNSNASLKTSSDEWATVSSTNKGGKKSKKLGQSVTQTKPRNAPSDSQSAIKPNRFGSLESSETDSPVRSAPSKSAPGNTKTDTEKAKNRIYVDLEAWYSPDGELEETLENIRETLKFPADTETLIDIFFQYIVDKNVKSTEKLVELIQALQSELAQSGVEASVVTFFNTLPDIIEDLPLIPARMAQLIAPLSPNLLKDFTFLNDVIDDMAEESPNIVSTFVTELLNSLKKANPNYDNESSGLKQEYFSLALGSQFKQKISNSSACAEWINSLSEKERADPKLLLAIAEHVNRFFFKSSLTATPSEETIADEKDSLRKIQPVLQGLLKSGADEFFNALHSVLGKRSEDLYQRVRKEIEQFLKE